MNSYSKSMETPSCLVSLILGLLLMGVTCVTQAVDNPDAPDLIAAFETKEKVFIAAAENPKNGYRENLEMYTEYLEFLDKELNAVYQSLQAKLPKDRQQQLKQSQLDWIKYCDLEFSFIENTWVKADFGSSSSKTRGQYKTSIVRDRVIQLMHYAKTF